MCPASAAWNKPVWVHDQFRLQHPHSQHEPLSELINKGQDFTGQQHLIHASLIPVTQIAQDVFVLQTKFKASIEYKLAPNNWSTLSAAPWNKTEMTMWDVGITDSVWDENYCIWSDYWIFGSLRAHNPAELLSGWLTRPFCYCPFYVSCSWASWGSWKICPSTSCIMQSRGQPRLSSSYRNT